MSHVKSANPEKLMRKGIMRSITNRYELLEFLDQEHLWNEPFMETVKQIILKDEEFINELYSKIIDPVSQGIIERITSGELSQELNTMYREANKLLISEIRSMLKTHGGIKMLLNATDGVSSTQYLYKLFEQSATHELSPKLDKLIGEKVTYFVNKNVKLLVFDPRFRTKFLEMLRISHKAYLDTYTEIVTDTLGNDYASLEEKYAEELSKIIEDIEKIKLHIDRNRLETRYLYLEEMVSNICQEEFDNYFIPDRFIHKISDDIEVSVRDALEESIRDDLIKSIRKDFEESIRKDLESSISKDLEASIRKDMERSIQIDLDRLIRKNLEALTRYKLDDLIKKDLEQNLKQLHQQLTYSDIPYLQNKVNNLKHEINVLEQKIEEVKSSNNILSESSKPESNIHRSNELSSSINPRNKVPNSNQVPNIVGEIPMILSGITADGLDNFDFGLSISNYSASWSRKKQEIRIFVEIEVYDFDFFNQIFLLGTQNGMLTFRCLVTDSNDSLITEHEATINISSSIKSPMGLQFTIPIPRNLSRLDRSNISKVVIILLDQS
ncbi:hypothetical protein [Faecalibaculum rodentium]|uniref:hypothetical protein n=1 Tax=Faecalibaculum rodentium TaxID=1702221 RepID=UPI0025A0036A|nr:hypothetical protein [Faecalibaculum rodentium]